MEVGELTLLHRLILIPAIALRILLSSFSRKGKMCGKTESPAQGHTAHRQQKQIQTQEVQEEIMNKI